MATSKEDLQARFPNMKPISGAPSMSTVNGIGTGLYGRRDYDPETRTYIKTYCFCVLFIPLVAISAYRVADAGSNSWYFLGKEQLSPFARGWNWLLLFGLVAVVSSIGLMAAWNSHLNSPEYLQAEALEHAQHLATEGDYEGAAQQFSVIARSGTSSAPAAQTDLQAILDQHFHDQPGAKAVRILHNNREVSDRIGQPPAADLWKFGVQYFHDHRVAAPRDAQAMYDYLKRTAPDNPDLPALRIELLKALIAAEPDQPGPVVALAEHYESQQDLGACETLLAAHKTILGETEGARILGQIYYNRGDMAAAYPLLNAYTAGRLKHLQKVQMEFAEYDQEAWNDGLIYLRNGNAPQSWYTRHDAQKDDDAKRKMVDDYIIARILKDPNYEKKQNALKEAAKVVPLAFDLGIARLVHAQSLSDPAQRKAELEEIEKLFLGMESVAGDSDDYHLFFGQVCYWLGKQTEGRKQFDDLIENNDRSADALIAVASKLRAVGESGDAEALAEEAYNAETDAEKKCQIADFLSVVVTDVDKKVAWLEKTNLASASTQVGLHWAKGQKAAADRDFPAAIDHYKRVVAATATQPKSANSLNSAAIANEQLYWVTGERAYLDEAVTQLEEAVSLSPKDSVLIANSQSVQVSALCLRLWGNLFQYRKLELIPALDHLNWAYVDHAGNQAMVARVKADPSFPKILNRINRQLTLAPQNGENWTTALTILTAVDDIAGMKDLLQRRRTMPVDEPWLNATITSIYSGENDALVAPQYQLLLQRLDGQLTNRALALDDPTRALLMNDWVEKSLLTVGFGLTPDPDKLLERAVEARRLKPCGPTTQSLINVCLYRALTTLAAKYPAVADLAKRGRRSCPDAFQMAWWLDHLPDARAEILKNPDFNQAVGLLKLKRGQFPQGGHTYEWALLRHADPATAEIVATNLRTREELILWSELNYLISPLSGYIAFDAYYRQVLASQPDAAEKELQKFRDRGMPLPDAP